jgi:hypothetical protein
MVEEEARIAALSLEPALHVGYRDQDGVDPP